MLYPPYTLCRTKFSDHFPQKRGAFFWMFSSKQQEYSKFIIQVARLACSRKMHHGRRKRFQKYSFSVTHWDSGTFDLAPLACLKGTAKSFLWFFQYVLRWVGKPIDWISISSYERQARNFSMTYCTSPTDRDNFLIKIFVLTEIQRSMYFTSVCIYLMY